MAKLRISAGPGRNETWRQVRGLAASLLVGAFQHISARFFLVCYEKAEKFTVLHVRYFAEAEKSSNICFRNIYMVQNICMV